MACLSEAMSSHSTFVLQSPLTPLSRSRDRERDTDLPLDRDRDLSCDFDFFQAGGDLDRDLEVVLLLFFGDLSRELIVRPNRSTGLVPAWRSRKTMC